ncbi:hypothetical protein [Streptomyces nitrosporeus]|uniref:Uncharacterized protein n=1 Tax=Streptomyces nitrosporeus TaxID=28894 RepID=A0A5J6F9V6_9ACTN|nr:hypothetical protein [Streptomyces nitrosporeus]QEU72816.1 hypothetical protein CP967_13145 [Streptomyces nitrosporeus]GGY74765.1 hypothetical protein GCM10010327_00590 [Streptomyces nitrosporeus]
MPTPERDVEERSPWTRPPSASAVSMKDLLASCAAATAVSTPPREETPADGARDGQDDRPAGRCEAA